MRNRATAKLRSAKKDWERQKLDAALHNPATIWKNVKFWLSCGNSGPPSRLFTVGEMLRSPSRVAGDMNSFFYL